MSPAPARLEGTQAIVNQDRSRGLDARLHQMAGEGSTEAGKLPMEQRVGTVRKLSLELDGNALFIVFDDADIEMAVKSLPLRRQGVPSPRNIATPARLASAPIASWCRTASMTPSPSASPRPPGR